MSFNEYNDMIRGWIREVMESRGIDAEKTIQFCNIIEEYGDKMGDSKLIGFACYYRAETYYILNNIEQVFKNIIKGLEHLQRAEEWELTARGYNMLAITSLNRGNAPFALDYYLSALAYSKKYEMDEIRNMVNVNIGSLYMGYGEYRQALRYLDESYQYLDALDHPTPEDTACLMVVYISMANCYLGRELYDKARELEQRTLQECGSGENPSDQLYLLCFQARLNHQTGRTLQRDECIAEIRKICSPKIALLDIFDDLYSYCLMLLEIGKHEELWEILAVLEALTRQSGITNLEKRLLSIKIKYYKETMDHASYLQAAGLYYEMCEITEKENQNMVTTMVDMRLSLEVAKQRQRQVENENEYLQKKSETDPLTGLANRFRLNEIAEDCFQNAYVDGKMLAIEILDIDYFKQYNDNYGHQAGDQCILKIAEAIKKLERYSNVFTARYGGDEFIVVYLGYEEQMVEKFAQELRQRVIELQIPHAYSKVMPNVTVSQGICCDIPGREMKVWDFLHIADQKLYEGKKRSRNSICTGRMSVTELA